MLETIKRRRRHIIIGITISEESLQVRKCSAGHSRTSPHYATGSACKSGFTPLTARTSASEAVGDAAAAAAATDRRARRRARVYHPFSRYRALHSVRYHEARVAARLPSAAATESRLGRSRAANALADDDGRSGDALPSRIRSGRRRRRRDVLRYRRALFVQSAVDRPQRPATVQ